jgi:hypothetical protein
VNNRLDPSLFSPAALKLAAKLPKTTDPCGRFEYTRSRPQDEAQYIGKVDLQLNQNHTMFGRYICTTFKVTPPFALQPDNVLVSSLGGRDNVAQSLTIGDTMVLSNATVNSLRAAVNYTDVHRLHEPIGFSAADLGINVYSYIDKYMLLSVQNGGFQIGAARKRGSFPDADLSGQRRRDDGEGQSPVRRGRERRVLDVAVARQRALAGQFTFTERSPGLPLADFPQRAVVPVDSGDPELARHAAVVSRALRAGHVEAVAEGDP